MVTTYRNCAAQSEFIGAHPACVLWCGVWTNVASPHQKSVTSTSDKLQLFPLTVLWCNMSKCKSNKIWLENSAVSASLKPIENNKFGARCTLCKKTLKLGTFGIKLWESHGNSEKHKGAAKSNQKMPAVPQFCSVFTSGAVQPQRDPLCTNYSSNYSVKSCSVERSCWMWIH